LYNGRVKDQKFVQQKFTDEASARAYARTLGRTFCTIIHSREAGVLPEAPKDSPRLYYVEHGGSVCGFVRYWETLVFEGEGRKA
jgi:hypothetical protein